MIYRPRNMIAILVVATALFADRAVANAPALRPEVFEQTAARIMDRLTVRFRRTVSVGTVYEVRGQTLVRIPVAQVAPQRVEPAHRPTLPTFFRLPPPLA
jgi:hypothetical protein